jgi:hypothetical protein
VGGSFVGRLIRDFAWDMQLVLVLYRSRAGYFIVVEKFDDDAQLGAPADYGWDTFSCFPHVALCGGAST